MKKEFLTRLSVCVVCPSLFLSSVLVFGLFEIFISFFTCIEKIHQHFNTQHTKREEKRKEETTFVSVSKKRIHFFFISSSLSRARLCAHLRAHIISLFFCVRARTRARKSHALLSSIDLYRPLSMIVDGRVGALFFIVCFLSVLEIQIERFCISPPAWQIE